MLPTPTMSALVHRLSALSLWTLSVIIIIVIIIASIHYYIRRRRRLEGNSGSRRPPPVSVSSSSKTCPPGASSTDCWLQTVMEWVWLRRHVTWRHLANCGVDAWMTALTEQANRHSVSGAPAPLRWLLPRDAVQARPMPSCCVLSVRLSRCLSRSCILSKRLKISIKYFHHRVAIPF